MAGFVPYVSRVQQLVEGLMARLSFKKELVVSPEPMELSQELTNYRVKYAELLNRFDTLHAQLRQKKIENFEELVIRDRQTEQIFIQLAQRTAPVKMEGVNIGFFGLTSTGKSTMINALLGQKVAETGVGETTTKITPYNGTKFTLWDVPGRQDELSYFSMEYISFLKGLTRRLILIQVTIKENSSLMKLLDEIGLDYDIVFNKFDQIDQDEQTLLKEQIQSEVKRMGLKRVKKIYFLSGKHPKMFNDWLLMVNDLTQQSTSGINPTQYQSIDQIEDMQCGQYPRSDIYKHKESVRPIRESILDPRPTQDEDDFVDDLFTSFSKNHNYNKNLIILYYGVKLPDKNILSTYEMKTSDNPFKFITETLSIKNKAIYLIISTSETYSIIPIVYKHICIEKIYLCGPNDTGLILSRSLMFEKVTDSYEDLDELCRQILEDISMRGETSASWNRSSDFFTMLYTQRLGNESLVFESLNNAVTNNEFIMIFHCDDRKLIHLDQTSIPISEFINANDCIRMINEKPQCQIFLIISGSRPSTETQSILTLQQIRAIYFFVTDKTKYTTNERKVMRLFNDQKDLSEQLYSDIFFYREQHIHTVQVDIFTTLEHTKQSVSPLNPQQTIFLIYNLFINILPQIPLLKYHLEDLKNICANLFPSKGNEVAEYIHQLREKPSESKIFVEDPKFAQIILKLHQSNKLNELFIVQKQIIDIQKQAIEKIDLFTFDSVYAAKIISNDTLATMQSNIGQYINLRMLVLTTKSLLTARSIARQAANNRLISVLFHIELMQNTRLFQIRFDRVIFPFGSVFRLESIDLGPDGVYYVKIKFADLEFQSIKQQLQFEIEVPLSWLTFGNYLYLLKQLEQAKSYFEYLLEKLPSDHIDRLAIYNNLALIYTMENNKNETINPEEIYKEALGYAQSIKFDSTMKNDIDEDYVPMSITLPNTTIEQSTVIARIAELHHQKGDYKLALEHYQQALKLSTDRRCRFFYQHMIENVKEKMDIKV